jgi:hypothetical protein
MRCAELWLGTDGRCNQVGKGRGRTHFDTSGGAGESAGVLVTGEGPLQLGRDPAVIRLQRTLVPGQVIVGDDDSNGLSVDGLPWARRPSSLPVIRSPQMPCGIDATVSL